MKFGDSIGTKGMKQDWRELTKKSICETFDLIIYICSQIGENNKKCENIEIVK